ncbi:MAG TPA: hypothetical protein VNV66_03530 [Pilimelia sp.]|nr:hypothetical protein [Pilimelia sp.]
MNPLLDGFWADVRDALLVWSALLAVAAAVVAAALAPVWREQVLRMAVRVSAMRLRQVRPHRPTARRRPLRALTT